MAVGGFVAGLRFGGRASARTTVVSQCPRWGAATAGAGVGAEPRAIVVIQPHSGARLPAPRDARQHEHVRAFRHRRVDVQGFGIADGDHDLRQDAVGVGDAVRQLWLLADDISDDFAQRWTSGLHFGNAAGQRSE